MSSQKEERPGVRASSRQAAGAWLGVRLPTVKATGSAGQGTARAPKVFPNHWKQDTAASPTPEHNIILRVEAINGNVFLEGQNMSGGFSEMTHRRIKIQTAFKCSAAGAIPGLGSLPCSSRPEHGLQQKFKRKKPPGPVFLSLGAKYLRERHPWKVPPLGRAQMSHDLHLHLPIIQFYSVLSDHLLDNILSYLKKCGLSSGERWG